VWQLDSAYCGQPHHGEGSAPIHARSTAKNAREQRRVRIARLPRNDDDADAGEGSAAIACGSRGRRGFSRVAEPGGRGFARGFEEAACCADEEKLLSGGIMPRNNAIFWQKCSSGRLSCKPTI
jgi:hypothetical protein